MQENIKPQPGKPSAVVSRAKTWMLYGATGYTGTLIAQRGLECGHRPVLAGRTGGRHGARRTTRPSAPGSDAG